jgi:hypothetical protein
LRRDKKVSERERVKTGWFVEIVRCGLKLRYIPQFTQIFCPEDRLPASSFNVIFYPFLDGNIPENLSYGVFI